MTSSSISMKPANSADLRKAIFDVRRAVFVNEQKVPAHLEYDEYETTSTHLAASIAGKVVGTCRYRNTQDGVKLERFAVLREFRGKDVGRYLVAHCLENLKNEAVVYLNAQIQVVEFYEKFGFLKIGPQFVEAGIQHYKMVWKKAEI